MSAVMKIVPVGTEVVLRTVERDVPDPTTGCDTKVSEIACQTLQLRPRGNTCVESEGSHWPQRAPATAWYHSKVIPPHRVDSGGVGSVASLASKHFLNYRHIPIKEYVL